MEEMQNVEKQISIKELVLKIQRFMNYLKTKWIAILLCAMIGGAVFYAYAYFQKPVYTATLSFVLEDEKSGGGMGLSGLASQFGLDLGTSAGGAFTGGNLIELMQSRSLVERTLLNPVTVNSKIISLVEYYIQFNELRKDWENKPVLANIQFLPNTDRSKYTLQQDSILGIIYQRLVENNLNVLQPDKKISFINIEVKSINELFSKLFVEILAHEVSAFYITTKSKKAMSNVTVLERQADSVRKELNNAIAGVAYANDNTYNLNPSLNIKRVPSVKRQVDVQANTAILTQLVTNLELAKMTLMKETPLIQVVDKPILPLKKDKISKLGALIRGVFMGALFSILFYMTKRLKSYLMA